MDTSKTLLHGEIRVNDERAARRGELALGRYRLLDRLGSGGFGTVWRARDEQLARTVALKRIALPYEQERERALREARATARLAHPAIVALYEAYADEEAFYLISELVEGDTLARLIAAGELDDEQIGQIGVALADGLRHAHARGVVHRDVKPQNVLVPRERASASDGGAAPVAAKLADFGGALLAGGEALTRTGDVYGTLAYMAPEQSEGQAVGPAADLYSLALVLYEAFSGINPVRGRTPAATARRIGSPIEPLERRRRDLPRELTRALDTALAPDPRRRGTLTDLRETLTAAYPIAAQSADRDRRWPAGRSGRPRSPEPARSLKPTRSLESTQPYERSGSPPSSWVRRAPDPDEGHAREPPPRSEARTHERDPKQADPQVPGLRRALALPRPVWIGLALALALWQAVDGLPGVALLLLAGAAPLLLLPRRSGPGWLVAAAAPALGALGLAAAYPALAGQRAGALGRAGLAALGFWWLALAEPLLARRLWLGPPVAVGARPAWERSLAAAATRVLGGVITPELAIGAAVWALAALVLPWIVRGRSAALDVLVAIAWSVFLLAAAPFAERAVLHHSAAAGPRGALLGTMLGCALAICARALRGPVRPCPV